MSSILGLDLGSKLGACLRNLETGDVRLWWHDWSHLPSPDRVIEFGKFLAGHPFRNLPGLVVGYEEIMTAKGKGLYVIHRQEGVLWYLSRANPFVGVQNLELKKFATGDGTAKKPAMVAAAVERLQEWGSPPLDQFEILSQPAKEDVADAIHVTAWVEAVALVKKSA